MVIQDVLIVPDDPPQVGRGCSEKTALERRLDGQKLSILTAVQPIDPIAAADIVMPRLTLTDFHLSLFWK